MELIPSNSNDKLMGHVKDLMGLKMTHEDNRRQRKANKALAELVVAANEQSEKRAHCHAVQLAKLSTSTELDSRYLEMVTALLSNIAADSTVEEKEDLLGAIMDNLPSARKHKEKRRKDTVDNAILIAAGVTVTAATVAIAVLFGVWIAVSVIGALWVTFTKIL